MEAGISCHLHITAANLKNNWSRVFLYFSSFYFSLPYAPRETMPGRGMETSGNITNEWGTQRRTRASAVAQGPPFISASAP